MEPIANSEWVAKRLATAEPEWRPNADWARTRLNAKLLGEVRRRRPGRRLWAAASFATVTAAVLLAVAAAAVPSGGALAQELWHRFVLKDFDVVRLDLSRIPLAVSISTNGLLYTVADLGEAERKSGYWPAVPPPEVVAGESAPKEIVVTGPIDVRQVVDVRELRAALARAGAADVVVPGEWQGSVLQMHVEPMVITGYGSDLQIVQTKPIELHVNAGFPLARFAETAFRCTGIPAWQARAMGEKFARNPVWLLDIPEDEIVRIEEVSLRSGITGLMVEDPKEEDRGTRVTLLFGTRDRIYAVSSGSREQTLRVANSLQ